MWFLCSGHCGLEVFVVENVCVYFRLCSPHVFLTLKVLLCHVRTTRYKSGLSRCSDREIGLKRGSALRFHTVLRAAGGQGKKERKRKRNPALSHAPGASVCTTSARFPWDGKALAANEAIIHVLSTKCGWTTMDLFASSLFVYLCGDTHSYSISLIWTHTLRSEKKTYLVSLLKATQPYSMK